MSNTKIKTGPKVLAVALVIGGLVAGGNWYVRNHGDAKAVSVVPTKSSELADFKETTSAEPAALNTPTPNGLPSTTVAQLDAKRIKMLVLPWNAQMGLALANGGPLTTEGSLLAKAGVNLQIERQDDYSKMQEDLVSCANQLSKGNKTCTSGASFAVIMGDGGPAFLAGLNGTLAKLGQDYRAEIIGAAGRSNGEDQFLVPASVKDNPKSAAGLVVAGVLKDGDWNLAMFWAAENEICNNPDVSTFDPNCINWVGTSSFTEAAEKYIQGACEERPVVSHGKKTGERKTVCVNSAVVWTPADVSIAKKKGGLVQAISTRQNGSQMAATIIGIRKFDTDNHETVRRLLGAILEAGNQIKHNSLALKRAGDASAAIYKEETGNYWVKYYKGVDEEDATGNVVSLGGSRVFNLADNIRYFGLEQGSVNAYAATYTMFGDIAKQQYPVDLPSYPTVDEVLNTGFLKELAASGVEAGKADAPSFEDVQPGTDTVAKRSWHISFDSGKASFKVEADGDLKQLLDTLVVASDTVVEIHGHTDADGSPDKNHVLSSDRANAVKVYLEKHAPASFPKNRITVFAHGQDSPVATNSTPAGKAANRRVDIVLKSSK